MAAPPPIPSPISTKWPLLSDSIPHKVTQFLEDPNPLSLKEGRGGSDYDISVYVKAYAIFSQTNKITK